MKTTESTPASSRRGHDAIYWREFDLALRQCGGLAAVVAAVLAAALTLPPSIPGRCSTTPTHPQCKAPLPLQRL